MWVAALGDPRMAEDCLLEAVRGLRLAHPELGPKPLLAKLREQQLDMGAGNKEVREALLALKAESEATAAAAAPPAAAAPMTFSDSSSRARIQERSHFVLRLIRTYTIPEMCELPARTLGV